LRQGWLKEAEPAPHRTGPTPAHGGK